MNRLLSLALFLLLAALPALATAQEKTDPKQIVIGVVTLSLNAEYVSMEMDGKSWENFFFEDDGLTLVIEGVDRSVEHLLTLTPMQDELKPAVVRLRPKEWKLVRLDRETRQWQLKRKVKLVAWKPGEKEKFLEEQRRREEEERKKQEDEQKRLEEEAAAAEVKPAPTEPEKTPAPAPTEPEKTPAPAPTEPEKTPAPAPTEPEKTPAPAPTEPEETPAPAPTEPEAPPAPAPSVEEK